MFNRDFKSKALPLTPSKRSMEYHALKPVRIIMGITMGVIILSAAQPTGAADGGYKSRSMSSPVVTAACLPLLQTVHQSSTTDVTIRNQRNAGKVAVLGLALGVRYALQPTSEEAAPAHILKSEQNGERALDIIKYRNCVKQNALKTDNQIIAMNVADLN